MKTEAIYRNDPERGLTDPLPELGGCCLRMTDGATQIEWEYATEVHRNWLTLRSVQGAVGLTDEQVDELFIRAASL